MESNELKKRVEKYQLGLNKIATELGYNLEDMKSDFKLLTYKYHSCDSVCHFDTIVRSVEYKKEEDCLFLAEKVIRRNYDIDKLISIYEINDEEEFNNMKSLWSTMNMTIFPTAVLWELESEHVIYKCSGYEFNDKLEYLQSIGQYYLDVTNEYIDKIARTGKKKVYK